VRAYCAILSARCRVLLQYRAAAIAGVVTQTFFGLIIVMVMRTFYASRPGVEHPMTIAEVVTYVWLGQAMIRLIIWHGDSDVQEMVRSGGVAYELLKPVDLYTLWYVRGIALIAAPVLLRAVPMLVIAKLFFGMSWPASPAAALAWAVATMASVLLAAAMCTLASISLMWTISGEGLRRFLSVAAWFLSGIVVPLPLFPHWAQAVMAALPFRGLIDTPLQLYIGRIPPGQAAGAVAQQLAWTAACVLLGRALVARGKHRLVVQGG
jgi:viologen exporter family transport system permease protein